MPARQLLIERIETFISAFEETNREPDTWQSAWLMRALASLQGGDYRDGEKELERAQLSPELRSPHDVKTSTRYALLPITEHRANFERIKIQSRR